MAVFATAIAGCRTDGGEDTGTEAILARLDRTVAERELYIQKKESRIEGMKSVLNSGMTDEERYRVYDRIYDEYYQYNMDSAIVYAKKKFNLASGITPPHKTDATLDLAERYILSSAYVDAIRLLDSIDTTSLDKEYLKRYYHARQSLYEDMAGTSDDLDLRLNYDGLRRKYRQLRLEQLDSTDIEYLYVRSEIMREQGRGEEMLPELLQKCASGETDTHQKAILNYIAANIYKHAGDSLKVVQHYATSAINDLITPVNDYLALKELATMLYKAGDIERAYSYITRSVHDIIAAHSKLNMQSAMEILPVITSAYEAQLKGKHTQLVSLLIWMSLLVVLLIWLTGTVFRERSRTYKKNELLEQANIKLEEYNRLLLESNDIKEAYLSKYMDMCSTYIEAIENYRSHLRKTAKTGGFEKIMENLKSANYTNAILHDFYAEFDATFLKLFPDFAVRLNEMLQPDKRLKDPTSEGMLTTELRVMALIRLGINDSAKIAHFLRRSLSTIYNYRVKIRNAAIDDREDFDSRVMRISSPPPTKREKDRKPHNQDR